MPSKLFQMRPVQESPVFLAVFKRILYCEQYSNQMLRSQIQKHKSKKINTILFFFKKTLNYSFSNSGETS